jgi:hypothetical protein
VIPDTQGLALRPEYNQYYSMMADWIVAQKSNLNIQAVLHVGDITHNNTVAQWEVASAALNQIKDAGIPFIPCRGNHDDIVGYNQYFGYGTFQEFASVGKYSDTDARNYYVELEVEGEPYLIFSVDFGPNDDVMEWVSSEIHDHPAHHVMLVTHSYMYPDGTHTSPDDPGNPKLYYGSSANTGEEMWTEYLQQHPNVEGVFSGHHFQDGHYAHRLDFNARNRAVFQAFQNWQNVVYSGNGRVCVYQITPHTDPAAGDGWYGLTLNVYDTVLDQYLPEYDLQVKYGAILPWLVGDMRQFSRSRFSRPGTQVRQVSVGIADATVNATRMFTAAPRFVEVEIQGGTLDAQAYLAAAPSYLVPGARRFGLSRFSAPGTLQSRTSAVAGDEGSLVSTRTPLVAADRPAAIAAAGGYQSGKSYALPDVSGGVNASFEEVYPV